MRLRPFVPAYLLLGVAVAYALGSLWTDLDRLDAIERYTQASARSEQAVAQLESLSSAAVDIENGGRSFILTGDASYLESFERGRKRAPELLAELRRTVGDQPAKLAQIEQLVPLLAELIAVARSGIDRRRAATDPAVQIAISGRKKEIVDKMRITLRDMLAAEQSELVAHREVLLAAQIDSRRDAFIAAGLMLVLIAALVLALRRIRAFVHPQPIGTLRRQIDGDALTLPHAGLGELLQDGRMRVQAAIDSAGRDSAALPHLQSLRRTLERALVEHADVGQNLDTPAPSPAGLPEMLAALVSLYSGANGLKVSAVVDSAARVSLPETAHLICRSAQWGLEVIATRKRSGEIRFDCAREDGAIALRVYALVDDPVRAIAFTPRELEHEAVLRRAIEARGGSFELAESPTGLVVSVRLPDLAH